MTAIPLFDALVRARSSDSGNDQTDTVPMAERLIGASIADLKRIDDYEKEFGQPDLRSSSTVEILTSVYRLYEEWAGEAEQILRRVRPLVANGQLLPSAASLEDAYGRIQARLRLTPDKIARGIEDARENRTIPGEVIRDELRARLRR